MAGEQKNIQHYSIIRRIEESNYAVLYKVKDPDSRPLVLKIAQPKDIESNELISREFQILSQFKHPNIVPVFDYSITDDGRAYFTLEYIPGKSLNQCFTNLSQDFIGAVIQVVNGLGAFHNRGFIHGDLKPEHIIYDENKKKSVLIDFGFAGLSAQNFNVGGTFGYMAPEAIKGIGVDQRSDLYSLGVIFYEILSRKKFKDTFAPIEGVPEEFNNLISRLVSAEPVVRPSALDLYHILAKYLPPKEIDIPPYKVTLPSTGFVQLPGITEKLSSANGRTYIIIGNTGAGKTRLLQEMKFKYLMNGYSVLFYISRQKSNFNETLQTFINKIHINSINKENRFQIYEEIMSDLLNFAKTRKVIIMLDDLNELSDYELDLFRYMGYGIKESSILLIGTSKSNEKVKGLNFETITLMPFSSTEIEELLKKTFFELKVVKEIRGSSHTFSFADWLHKQSGGNPLFIVETLKMLYENRTIQYQDRKWYVKANLLEKTSIPAKLEDLLKKRIRSCKAAALKVLKILCLANCPLEPSIIASIVKYNANIAIEHLKAYGLLMENNVGKRRIVTIPNHILLNIIKKFISKTEEQKLSRALIEAIETYLRADKYYLPILAQLSDRSKQKTKVYKYFQKSAKNAEAIYDYDSALKFHSKSLAYEKKINPTRYKETLITIADIHQATGNCNTAMKYYNKALRSRTKDLLSSIYEGLGHAYSTMGHHAQAVEHLKKALSLTPNKDTYDYIKIANRLAYSLILLKQMTEAKNILDESLTLAKKVDNVEMTSDTIYYQAVIEWSQGEFDKGMEKARENLEYTKKHKLTKQFAYTANLLSMLNEQKGNINQAGEYLDEAIENFKRMKLMNALMNALYNQTSLHVWQGNFSRAEELCKKALILAQQIDNREMQAKALSRLANINESLSKFDVAIELNNDALSIDPNNDLVRCSLSMIYYKKDEMTKAYSILKGTSRTERSPLHNICLALIKLGTGEKEHASKIITKEKDVLEKNNVSISEKINFLLMQSQYYHQKGNIKKSLGLVEQSKKLSPQSSVEYIFANALIKIYNFELNEVTHVDIDEETTKLEAVGCLYHYVYLKRLVMEAKISAGIRPKDLPDIMVELNRLIEISNAVGARSELNHTKRLKEKLPPLISQGYAQWNTSSRYLDTFSSIAQLISDHLGDEDFTHNALDIIIQTARAERGALFIMTPQGLTFVAGRNMDRTTIKDANELSKTAIKGIRKNMIVFTQDALSDPNFNVKKSVMINQIRSLLCAPLVVTGEIIGALYLDSRLTNSIFGPQDKDFLLTVSKILASVIEKSMAFQRMNRENILLKSKMIEEIGSGYLIGKSRPMKKIYKLIDSVAQITSPVLLVGETGTGKGMLARLIHLKSKRKNQNFLTINCATIPETLLESELFGHKKGSFTGAISDKKGLLEEAHAGTVFLDEIANTTPAFQAKLLEAIEEKVIRRVGETQKRTIDVRFLFATNKDLEIEVEERRFRKDLYYRINVFCIEVPPLRERESDIPSLAQHFLNKYSSEVGKTIHGFTPEVMQQLREYYWPGNVRELQNVIERAVVLTKEKVITLKDLGLGRIKSQEVVPLREIKKEAIIEALGAANGHVQRAAAILGVNRRTIQRYIKKYNIKK